MIRWRVCRQLDLHANLDPIEEKIPAVVSTDAQLEGVFILKT